MLTSHTNFVRILGMKFHHLTCVFIFLFFSLSSCYAADSFEEIKKEIQRCLDKLGEKTTAQEKSQIYYQLAMAYAYDQEVNKAFHAFLDALECQSPSEAAVLCEEEASHYGEALDYYLSGCGVDPVRTAKELIQRYGNLGKLHKEYYHLNFLLATAYANLGMYDLFFERFYPLYPQMQDSFLASKTQGILYFRLSQNESDTQLRRKNLAKAVNHLHLALEKNPQDGSLYKTLIFLAKEEESDALVLSYLQKLVDHRPKVARGDIYLYVREAVALEEYELAQEIINSARTLYEYSRAITEAQDYLNQHKG